MVIKDNGVFLELFIVFFVDKLINDWDNLIGSENIGFNELNGFK